ncbi:MAG: IS4 family transposase [Deltaproteobacteria bacterium]|nr:IS4 family transposase [Deltaproteobacteria bacterium]
MSKPKDTKEKKAKKVKPTKTKATRRAKTIQKTLAKEKEKKLARAKAAEVTKAESDKMAETDAEQVAEAQGEQKSQQTDVAESTQTNTKFTKWQEANYNKLKSNVNVGNQLINLIPSDAFNDLVVKYNTEYASKGISSWDHFVTMVVAQFLGCDSLREISGAIGSVPNRYDTLFLNKSLRASSISYVNQHRDWRLFKGAFDLMYNNISNQISQLHGSKLDFDFDLYALDSTTIELCKSMFDWALYRNKKGGLKAHTIFNCNNSLPCFVLITEAKQHDVLTAQQITAKEGITQPSYIDGPNDYPIALPKGSVLVLDRGYNDYALFKRWCDEGLFFVTKAKTNISYDTTKILPVPQSDEFTIKDTKKNDTYRVVSDCYFKFHSANALKSCPEELRMVTIKSDNDGKEIQFITNIKDKSAFIISRIYKERWQIENFFRLIKQNLVIKSFLGTSVNAINCQIWSALTAILLLKYLQAISMINWNFANLAHLIKVNFFSHINLFIWINIPVCDHLPDIPDKEQKKVKRREYANTLF